MIITHNDLDGFVSALIALAISGQNPQEVYTFSYEPYRDAKWQELIPKSNSDIWFVDISLRPGELEWARKSNLIGKQKWYWVDYHLSSLEFYPDGIFDEIHLDTSGKKCASDILWDLYRLSPRFMRYSNIYPWVLAAHDRDIWINNHLKLELIIKDAIRAGSSVYSNLLHASFQRMPEQLIKGMQETCER